MVYKARNGVHHQEKTALYDAIKMIDPYRDEAVRHERSKFTVPVCKMQQSTSI